MKLSDYPIGTVIHIEGMGEHKLSKGESHPDGWYSDSGYCALGHVNQMQDHNEGVSVVSVPWGVTEQLIEMVRDYMLNSGYDAYAEDDMDPDTILNDAIEEHRKREIAKALVEQEKARADMRERMDEAWKRAEAAADLADRYEAFRERFGSALQEEILRTGPDHPDHPEYKNEDSNK